MARKPKNVLEDPQNVLDLYHNTPPNVYLRSQNKVQTRFFITLITYENSKK